MGHAPSIARWTQIAENAQRKADAAVGEEKAIFEHRAASARRVVEAMKKNIGRRIKSKAGDQY